ncbi:hypothetical protein STCU_09106 [Strigomonas culicis]|uniref:Uncharacterized protein n=1 Tax=Strigomonas culicis TaxID=28005 RepID=S9VAW1_9TRYP|nr:hypothetical protein STCU_09106 [Strigomonas culicis]|eukprot:EPY20215.1 hypothetical protein STCU_09106 [Strigomonas culicis]
MTKQMVASIPKEERHALVASMQLLLWAFDWQVVFSIPVSDAMQQDLRALTPAWLTDLFQATAPAAAAEEGAKKLLAPSHVKRQALLLAQGHETLPRLLHMYEWVVTHEERSADFRIFGLSVFLGNVLLRRRELPEKDACRIISYVGSSADVTLLLQCGVANRNMRASVANIFSQMNGPSAYTALKELWWKTPDKFRELQESRGDILSGVASANWKDALEKTEYAQAVGDGSWRKQLAETIRLLSDAGKHELSLQYIWEYHTGSGTDNLSVAASLSQTARHTGKWWLALDVLNLIASARIPQSTADAALLDEAQTHSMLMLKQYGRWREALALYASLEGEVPDRAFKTLCSLVNAIPPSAPWLQALAALQRDSRGIPAEVLRTVRLVKGVDRDASSLRASKYVWEGLSRGGDVSGLLSAKPERCVKYYDMCLLKALTVDTGADDSSVLAHLMETPSKWLEDRDFVELLFQQFRAKGWLPALHSMLRQHPSSQAAIEYDRLTLMMLRARTKQPMLFTDIRVAKHALLCCHQNTLEFLFKMKQLPTGVKDSRTHLSNLLGIERKWISVVSQDGVLRVKRDVAMSSVPAKTILYADHGLVVCEKPAGEAVRGLAVLR